MSVLRVTNLVTGLVRGFLRPNVLQGSLAVNPARTFKDKAVLKLRCKDCYFKKVDYRWWVLCKTHGRHKQREKLDDYRKKWIVTHHTIGHRPFQKKEEAYICNLAPPGPYDYKRKIFYATKESELLPKKLKLGLHQKLLIPWR